MIHTEVRLKDTLLPDLYYVSETDPEIVEFAGFIKITAKGEWSILVPKDDISLIIFEPEKDEE